MSEPTTNPSELARLFAKDPQLARALLVPQGPVQDNSGGGKNDLYKIVLSVAGALAVVVMAIFGWVATNVLQEQAQQSKSIATVQTKQDENTRRLAGVEQKLDILIDEQRRNGKP